METFWSAIYHSIVGSDCLWTTRVSRRTPESFKPTLLVKMAYQNAWQANHPYSSVFTLLVSLFLISASQLACPISAGDYNPAHTLTLISEPWLIKLNDACFFFSNSPLRIRRICLSPKSVPPPVWLRGRVLSGVSAPQWRSMCDFRKSAVVIATVPAFEECAQDRHTLHLA
jgi:hypothetical protein